LEEISLKHDLEAGMKKINFLQVSDKNPYKNILNSFINPIIKHLSVNNYNISCSVNPSCLNVNFFREMYLPQNGAFIVHGMADKRYRDANLIKGFDYVFVSGEAWKQKLILQGLDKNKIFVTGYVKLDPLFNGEYLKNKYKKPVILYAPTHTNSPSLQGKFEQYISKLLEKYEVINSVHPYNKSTKEPTMQYLIDSDVVISDCSSLIYEAWSLGKPVVFADWIVKDKIAQICKDSFEDYIYKNKIGYHANNINEFLELIDIALKNGMDKQTKDFIEGIFPTRLRGNSGKVTADILLKLSGA
jgi:CDP-glycerol glycerophosphotransferase (TagB/SpsB family)